MMKTGMRFLSQIKNKIQKYLHITPSSLFILFASIINVLLILSVFICIYFSHWNIKRIGTQSMNDVAVTDIMALNAQNYGSSGEVLGNVLNDTRLKSLMGEILAEKIDVLTMRKSEFTISRTDVESLIHTLIREYDPKLSELQVEQMGEYVYLLSGAAHSVEFCSGLEYRYSYFVLNEDVSDENREDIEEAYLLFKFLVSPDLPVSLFIFWLASLSIGIFLGKEDIYHTVRQAFTRHMTLMVIFLAIPLGIVTGSLATKYTSLGPFSQNAWMNLLIIIILFLIIEFFAAFTFFRVRIYRIRKSKAEDALQRIRAPFVKSKKGEETDEDETNTNEP